MTEGLHGFVPFTPEAVVERLRADLAVVVDGPTQPMCYAWSNELDEPLVETFGAEVARAMYLEEQIGAREALWQRWLAPENVQARDWS